MKKRNNSVAHNKPVQTNKVPSTTTNTPENSTEVNTAMNADNKDSSAVDTAKKQDSSSHDKNNQVDVKTSEPKVTTSDSTKAVNTLSKSNSKTDNKKTTSAKSTEDKATTKSTSNTSGKLALVISLIALGAVGFQYYQAQQTNGTDAKINTLKQELSQSIAQANESANTVKSQSDAAVAKANNTINSVNANLAQLKANEAKKSNDIEALQNRLTKSIQQVESAGSKQSSRKDWLLAEVEYLLRLANQRVLMENTPIGALALLKSADDILSKTDDVSIFSVRKALAADIAALAAVPHIDQEGMYLKIDALSEQINKLKLVPLTDKKKLPAIIDNVANGVATDIQAEQSSFSKVWDKASAKLEKLVVISHRDSAIDPLLSPAQQAGLLQNLHILFEQTQLSLLQRKPASYKRSIEKAELIIKTHFQMKDGVTKALLEGLNTLKDETVRVDMPSIAGSLNSLKAYLKQGAEIKSGAQG